MNPTQTVWNDSDSDTTLPIDSIESMSWGSLLWLDTASMTSSLLQFPQHVDTFIIGRHPQKAHFVLTDERVSGLQCVIHKGSHGVVLLEDTSTMGTYVNGRKFSKGEKTTLTHGDEITFVRAGKRNKDTLCSSNFVYRFVFRKMTMNRSGSVGFGGRSHTLCPAASGTRSPCKAWQRGALIGKGASAEVYLAITLDSGEMIAVKHVHGDVPHLDALQEVELLKQLRHRNIVSYLGVAMDPTDSFTPLRILMEYVPGGSLRKVLDTFGRFHENVVRIYATEVLLGIEYLHSMGVVHGDIKAANLLLSDTGTVKLADFGISLKSGRSGGENDAGGSDYGLRGTPCWMSPELIRNGRSSFSSDMWAFGCLLIELVTGKFPWAEMKFETVPSALFHISQCSTGPLLALPSDSSDALRTFVSACFHLDCDERPSATELLSFDFITTARVGGSQIGEVLLRRMSTGGVSSSTTTIHDGGSPPSPGIPTLVEGGTTTGLTEIFNRL